MKIVPHPTVSSSDKVLVDEAMEQLNKHWQAGDIQHLMYAVIAPSEAVTWRFSGNMRMHHIGLALGFMTADYHQLLLDVESCSSPEKAG